MPGAKHKPSSCKSFLPIFCEPERPLTQPVPEPATKIRRTLAERAGDTLSRKPTAPPSSRPLSSSVKSTITRKERGFSASTSTATSRAASRPASRSAMAPSFSASMGPGAKAPRPKSAYGQYAGTHMRSKSHHSTARPATSMIRRDEEDVEEEERGVQPFLISTKPEESFKALRKTRQAPQTRPHSISIPTQRTFHLSAARSISSPTFRPITPVQEEPADADCEDVCASLKALTLGAPDADNHNVGFGRGMPCSDEETNPFIKPAPPRDFPKQRLLVSLQLDLHHLRLELRGNAFLIDLLTTNVQTSTTIEWRLWSDSSALSRRRWRPICRRLQIRRRAFSNSRVEVCHQWYQLAPCRLGHSELLGAINIIG